MKKNHLAPTGLSMSQAQSVSNLCHQAVLDIDRQLNTLNNASLAFDHGGKTYTQVQAHPVVATKVMELLKQKTDFTAAQAFLMENIKAKDMWLGQIRLSQAELPEAPDLPELKKFKPVAQVGESWGWEQLSAAELAEYWAIEAEAATIGKFIHSDGKLNQLRTELPNLSDLTFIEMEKDKKTPVMIKTHNKAEELLSLHNDLAKIHREAEQRVNYFKAKVKNLVTLENARISKENADGQAKHNNEQEIETREFNTKYQTWSNDQKRILHEFEIERNKQIGEVAVLRIHIPAALQPIVDMFITSTTE